MAWQALAAVAKPLLAGAAKNLGRAAVGSALSARQQHSSPAAPRAPRPAQPAREIGQNPAGYR